MRRLFWFSLLGFVAIAAAADRPVEEFATSAGKVTVTPVRHASLMISGGGTTIAVDPWSQADFTGITPADLILITDIHADHFDPKGMAAVTKASTKVIAPAVVVEKSPGAMTIKNGEKQTFGNWTIEAIPMYNLTRGPAPGKLFHDKGRGNGYILTYGGKRFYIAGDTEGIPEMRQLKNIDVAFVPMNLPYTMTPAEAAVAVKEFKPKVVYPYHYRESDTKQFADALAGTGIDVRLRNWYQ